MEKYFLVFKTNTGTDKGKQLCNLLDFHSDSHNHLRGFFTKRAMLDFIQFFSDGISEYQMLKPIT